MRLLLLIPFLLASCATRPQPQRVYLPPVPQRAMTQSISSSVPSAYSYELGWDYTNGFTGLKTFRLYGDGPTKTNWDTGLVLRFSPPLSPGLWNLDVRAVDGLGTESDPSNVLTLYVLPTQVIEYHDQWAATLDGPRVNLTTNFFTNLPPSGFLFGSGKVIP